MIAVTSVTSCLGALSVCVADKRGAAKDFLTSPVSRGKITMGYITGSGAVGLIMTVIALALCEVYIVANGGAAPSPAGFTLLLLTVVLSVLCGNAIVFFVSIFIKTESAFAALSTIIGTLIGFLMGIYIPVGSLPDGVQWAIKCFPMSHAASMFKQILADGELAALFANAPPEALSGFREAFGVTFAYGGFTGGFWFSALVLAATTVLFYLLSAVMIRVQKR
jgi:multidrug/hemolysin transport system permease protein